MAKGYYMTMDCKEKPLSSRSLSGLCRKIFISETVKDGSEYTVYELSSEEKFTIKYDSSTDRFVRYVPEHVVPESWTPLNYTAGMRWSIESKKRFMKESKKSDESDTEAD